MHHQDTLSVEGNFFIAEIEKGMTIDDILRSRSKI